MKEIIHNEQQSLTNVINILNKTFFVLTHQTKGKKNNFLNDFIQTFQHQNASKSAWECIKTKAAQFEGEKNIVDPLKAFQVYKLTPYIGSIKDGVMFCEAMTIGLQMKIFDASVMSYRLDYAPDKLLHLNFEITHNGEKYPLCLQLKFSTGIFGFSSVDKQLCENDPQKMHTFLQAIKVKFWLKMTMANTITVNTSNNPDDSKLPAQQLFNFVRGYPGYELATLKEYIADLLPNRSGKAIIDACNTEQELMNCLIHKPKIRSKTRESIFISMSKFDDSRRLLENNYLLEHAQLTDSDKRIDSEQPPKIGQ